MPRRWRGGLSRDWAVSALIMVRSNVGGSSVQIRASSDCCWAQSTSGVWLSGVVRKENWNGSDDANEEDQTTEDTFIPSLSVHLFTFTEHEPSQILDETSHQRRSNFQIDPSFRFVITALHFTLYPRSGISRIPYKPPSNPLENNFETMSKEEEQLGPPIKPKSGLDGEFPKSITLDDGKEVILFLRLVFADQSC